MDDKKTLMFHGGQAIANATPATPKAPPAATPRGSAPPPSFNQGAFVPGRVDGQNRQPAGPPPGVPASAPQGMAGPGMAGAGMAGAGMAGAGMGPGPQPFQGQPQQAYGGHGPQQPQGRAPQGHPPQGRPPQGRPPQGGPQQGRPQGPQQGRPQGGPQQGQGGKPPWGNFQQGNPLGQMGGLSKKKIIFGIVGAIALAIASAAGLVVKNKYGGGKRAKGTISFSRLGVSKTSANVDELIGSLEGFARGWRRDATWFGLSIYGVRPDGTVDFTANNGGGAKVKFVSAKGVQAASKRVRKDSIKEYSITRKGARAPKIIGARKPWKDFRPIGIPNCKVTDLTNTLRERGFKDGTVRIGFDTKFAFGSGWAWTVDSKDKKLAGFYSMNDCSFVKAR